MLFRYPHRRRQCIAFALFLSAALLPPRHASAVDFVTPVDFVKGVQPFLETSCLSCHHGDEADGGLRLETRQAALTGGDNGPALVPTSPEQSSLYTRIILPEDDPEVMPPDGPRPTKRQIEQLKQWIADGAAWPAGVTLSPKARLAEKQQGPDNLELVRRIHAHIVEQTKLEESKRPAAGKMEAYQQKIPRTGATYAMQPIPGGKFLMGSPADEPHRHVNEGPQTEVAVDPFWMGKYEVTWDEYEPFMVTKVDRAKSGARTDYDPAKHSDVDAVSQPTAPYIEMSFGMGQRGYPAISMTQHAANKYCQWLSAQTGHFYRLPTEAEWEYACRAGTTTAYSFGDDPAELGQYAWYYDNSNEKYQKVGKKKPNPWGLYDMHGNVSEWTADQYVEDYFSQLGPDPKNPFIRPATLYPRTVRGGNWDDDPENLRSAYRIGSDPSWKLQDPQLPKSIWYHTNAQWLGFRIIRPLKVPSVEEMYHYWNSATDKR